MNRRCHERGLEFFLAAFFLCFGLTACRHLKSQGGSSEVGTTNAPVRALPAETNVIIVPAPTVTDPLFAKYDQVIIDTIKKRWQELLSTPAGKRATQNESGTIMVHFKLHSDGSISDLRTDHGGSVALWILCEKAVLNAAPFPKWSDDMRRAVGKDVREVSFTFDHSGSAKSK